MPKLPTCWLATSLCAALLGAGAPALTQDDEAIGFERTPPRLSFSEGEVSFLRPGAEDWSLARVNTPLAAGDEFYTAEDANLELQVGPRAYVRAGEQTQLGLTSLEPDYLQLRVTSGQVSLDLRGLEQGQTLELATPNAAFTVERTGYYRVEVDGETTTFTSRRGGRATLTPATGEPVAIAASEQVVVTGNEAPQVESYAAPELDGWDRWNYARTDEQIEAVSARYVPRDVYGVDDLDHHGDWRVVPTYGAIWVPRGVAVGWAPYSAGRWLYDPYYSWTWVDDASWGWAPYHYGRWVHVSGHWGWCPGPIVARPYYAPALVAFFGGRGFSVGVSIGAPHVGWVALGWGEPLAPWWGPRHFRSYPRWAGWGGPRVVNNVVIQRRTVVDVHEINVYQNARVHDAFVTVDRRHFGRRADGNERYTRGRPDRYRPVYDEHPVRPDRSSLLAERGSARRPALNTWERPVVATREPRRDPAPDFEPRRRGSQPALRVPRDGPTGSGAPETAPPVRVVRPSREGRRVEASERAPFGRRGESERVLPPPPPRFERSARGESAQGERRRELGKERAREPRPGNARVEEPRRALEAPGRREAPAPPETRGTRSRSTRRAEQAQAAPEPPRERPAAPQYRVSQGERSRRVERREEASARTGALPGEPASRVYPQRRERERRDALPREAEREPSSVRSRDDRGAPRGDGSGASGGTRDGQSRGRRGRD